MIAVRFVLFSCFCSLRDSLGLLLLLALVLGALGHAHQPVQEQGSDDVDNNINHADAKVAPPRLVPGADGRQEDVGVGDGAVAAGVGGVGVLQVAAGRGDIIGHVLAAGLAGGRDDGHELVGRARDGPVGQARRQHGGYQVRERAHPVHEDPEPRHGLGRGQDAAEEEAQREQHVGQVAARLGRLRDRDAGVGERAREDEELPDEKPHQAAALVGLAGCFGVLRES